MTILADQAELEDQQHEIISQIAALGDFRPGTLIPRYRKCGKENCHCAAPDHPGHGPSWSLTWSVDGKTRTRVIPPDCVEETRAQIAEYQQFRTLVAQLVATSTEICDARLGDGGSKKNTRRSSGRSRRKSPPNSTA